ncbi:hypothetical protein [Streptomyces sp. SS07]|uniref:hypothetical protein n=1 Tax=Streptomyces sp. SS07 TaxID=2015315 RepID=UPI00211B2EB5|nr:hypothetical protein [Streptomyces sp. SS07]
MAANSRTTRKTTAARPARTPRELAPEVREQDDDVTAAEAQELEATGRHITVDLCGEPVRAVPNGAWPVSAQRKLREGNLDGFMAAVLHEDDYELYEELDPTLDEFNQFVEDVGELSGEPQGKSRRPSGSSRRTRRR